VRKGVADRIDLIQMLENINQPMVESPMDCLTGKLHGRIYFTQPSKRAVSI
jgi:hypothetical protein